MLEAFSHGDLVVIFNQTIFNDELKKNYTKRGRPIPRYLRLIVDRFFLVKMGDCKLKTRKKVPVRKSQPAKNVFEQYST